ncbi:MAG: GTPase domain-containing protein [Pirellulales bacterium]
MNFNFLKAKQSKESNCDNAVFITGPTRTGKTCWLGSLQVALPHFMHDSPYDLECELRDLSEDNTYYRLYEKACEIVTGAVGEDVTLPPTEALLEYTLQFLVRKPPLDPLLQMITSVTNLFTPGKTGSARIAVLDPPGGVMLNGSEDERWMDFETQFYDFAKRARGMLFCIDVDRRETASEYFKRLPRFLSKLAGAGHLHFDRIVFLLTKADLAFESEGRGNLTRLERTNPVYFLKELLGPSLFNFLNYVDPSRTELACGWSSAYGFIPNDGSSNYDPGSNRLRTCHDGLTNSELIDRWRPYRVLEPLIYLTTGDSCSLTTFTRDSARFAEPELAAR